MNIETAKIQVCAKFRAGDIRRDVLLKFVSVYGDAICVPLRRTNMAAGS